MSCQARPTRRPLPRFAPLLVCAVVAAGVLAAFIAPPIVQARRDAALFEAVAARDVARTRQWLNAGANPNAPQSLRIGDDGPEAWWRRALWYVKTISKPADRGIVTRVALPLNAAAAPGETYFLGIKENKARNARRRAISRLLLERGAKPDKRRSAMKAARDARHRAGKKIA